MSESSDRTGRPRAFIQRDPELPTQEEWTGRPAAMPGHGAEYGGQPRYGSYPAPAPGTSPGTYDGHAQQPPPSGSYPHASAGPVTGPAAGLHQGQQSRPSAPLEHGGTSEMYAPARLAPAAKSSASHAIVPAGSVTGRSLTLVITIMCFLACLTAGAVYMINQSAAAWLREVASEASLQIEPKGSVAEIEKRVAEIAAFLSRQPGISGVRPLSNKESMDLLEPWLGQTEGLSALPIPRIVALEIDRQSPPDLDKLRDTLKRQYPGTSLDDHRHWQAQIRTVTRSFALGGLAILVLVGAATTAIIISATKSSMASNKDIVEVLHFVGATDRFIAREFEKHFLRLGVRAGMVGAALAMAIFVTMPIVMRFLGGGAVTQAELSRLVGTGALDLPGFFLLGIVVVVTAALCMLTSRYGVYRILNSQH